MSATQVKRLVNACRKFMLCMIRQCEEEPRRLVLAALSSQQEDELGMLKDKYKDLFFEIDGLPPKRSIDHEIMLTGESSLPNVGCIELQWRSPRK